MSVGFDKTLGSASGATNGSHDHLVRSYGHPTALFFTFPCSD